ncbi:hypothetical protein ABQJ54_04760 [Rhodanobacter sp. Si-c]|uniref:Uncharacterized protein n=1 Tax=Rhodanobacter lycopersici TaxID=3162487 RepID=A0ABV3QB45_9GAMM
MRAVYRRPSEGFDLDVHCAINGAMTLAAARQYFWFYGYPKPLAEAWVRSS